VMLGFEEAVNCPRCLHAPSSQARAVETREG
jgi:hypothetical protein